MHFPHFPCARYVVALTNNLRRDPRQLHLGCRHLLVRNLQCLKLRWFHAPPATLRIASTAIAASAQETDASRETHTRRCATAGRRVWSDSSLTCNVFDSCFCEGMQYAQCRPSCPSDPSWSCVELSRPSPAPRASPLQLPPLPSPPSPLPHSIAALPNAEGQGAERHQGYLLLGVVGILAACLTATVSGRRSRRSINAAILARARVDDHVVEMKLPPAAALLGDGLAAALEADAQRHDRNCQVDAWTHGAVGAGRKD